VFRIGCTEDQGLKCQGEGGFLDSGQLAPSPPSRGSGVQLWGPVLILVLFENHRTCVETTIV